LLVPLPVRFAGYASSCSVSQLKTACTVAYYSSARFILESEPHGLRSGPGHNLYHMQV